MACGGLRLSSRVGLVGARSDWLVPRGLRGEVWVDSWLSWGGSRRLAGACSGFMQFCDSGRGFLGETRDGLWGLWPHVDTRRLAGVLLVLVRARDDSWRTCGDSWCLVETRGDSRRLVVSRGDSWRTCGVSWRLAETRGDSRRFVAIRGDSWRLVGVLEGLCWCCFPTG